MISFYKNKTEFLERRIRFHQSELDRVDEHHEYAKTEDPEVNPVSRYRASEVRLLANDKADLEALKNDKFDATMAAFALNREDELDLEIPEEIEL